MVLSKSEVVENNYQSNQTGWKSKSVSDIRTKSIELIDSMAVTNSISSNLNVET